MAKKTPYETLTGRPEPPSSPAGCLGVFVILGVLAAVGGVIGGGGGGDSSGDWDGAGDGSKNFRKSKAEPDERVPERFRGQWVGEIRRGAKRYEVAIRLNGAPAPDPVGWARYSRPRCGAGRLYLFRKGRGTIEVEELYTRAGAECVGGEFTLRAKPGAVVVYTWVSEPGAVAATGVLRRPDR